MDLYEPVRCYFKELGYIVQAEVNDCDVVAIKDDQLIIIELKRSITIKLLMQATKRQRLTEQVYIAIPEPTYHKRSRKWRDICYLLRRLELGLIIVSFTEKQDSIEIIQEPKSFSRKKSMAQSNKAKQKIIAEVSGRNGDYNIGGSHQTKIHTAYKESAIFIACCLERYGQLSPKALQNLGTGKKTPSILQMNYYGWFKRIKRGIYELTERGLIEYNKNPEITEKYYNLLPKK